MEKKSLMSQLDPLIKQIESLDKMQRLLVCIGTIVGLGALYYFFLAKPIMDDTNRFKQDFNQKSQQLQVAKDKAAQLPRLLKEREMKKSEFKKAMKALPEKREIPSLLTSISQVGQETGVMFNSFKPAPEKALGFYAEIPVDIEMTGSYHNVVGFFDKATSLNRIVNIRSIKLKTGSNKADDKLSVSCQAVTYKFVEQKANSKKKKRKRR